MTGAVLANARLDDGSLADITIKDGLIATVSPRPENGPSAPPPLPPPGEGRGEGLLLDLDGKLLLPAFVEGHIHLDKTLLGVPWQPHRPGATVRARIEAEKRQLATIGLGTIERATALARQAVAFGTTRMRCHVDIDPANRLANLHAILAVKERFAGTLDIQIVAFPQSGILAAPGTAELLDAAMAEGADIVGGLDPAGIDGDVEGHLEVVFAVAHRRGAGIDIHLHDPGPLGAFQLRRVAERTASAGMAGKVAVSHAFALGAIDPEEFARTAAALAEAGVAIMTNGPGPVPMPPVAELDARGVLVFAGSDNIRNSWSPFGNGDMLERAMMIAYRAGLRTDAELRFAHALTTSHAARALGASPHALTPGCAADLVALDAAHVPHAVAERPGGRIVFKQGRRVA